MINCDEHVTNLDTGSDSRLIWFKISDLEGLVGRDAQLIKNRNFAAGNYNLFGKDLVSALHIEAEWLPYTDGHLIEAILPLRVIDPIHAHNTIVRLQPAFSADRVLLHTQHGRRLITKKSMFIAPHVHPAQ